MFFAFLHREIALVRRMIENRDGSIPIQYGVIALFVAVAIIGSVQRILIPLALAFQLAGLLN